VVLVAASRQARTFLPDAPIARYARRDRSIPPRSPRRGLRPRFSKSLPSMVPGRRRRFCASGGLHEAHDGSFATVARGAAGPFGEIWTDRYRDLRSPRHQVRLYLREPGEQVEVTLHHPHGQIYAYPFVRRWRRSNWAGTPVDVSQCRVIQDGSTARRRILINEGGIVAYVPEAARWPYEVHVATRAHRLPFRTFVRRSPGNPGGDAAVSRAPSTVSSSCPCRT